jgi:hypothetical protein
VQPTQISCREHRQGHELDIVALQAPSGQPETIIAIGEAKASANPVGIAEVTRLQHLRELLPPDLVGALPRLLLFGRAGFTRDVTEAAAQRSDLELVDLARLYTGA